MAIPYSYDIAAARGATTYKLLYESVDRAFSFRFDSSNWEQGVMNGVAAKESLIAETVAGGTWLGAVPFMTDDPQAGVHITYDGSGVTVEYSLDGTVWTAVTNKRTILEGSNVTGNPLHIRITIANDTGYMNYLILDFLASRQLRPFGGAGDLLFKGAAFDQTPDHQTALQTDSGAQMSAGYLEYSPVVDSPSSVQTVEFWFKRDSSGTGTFLNTGTASAGIGASGLTLSGMTMYVNGSVVAANYQFVVGTWYHIVAVLTSSTTAKIVLANNTAYTAPVTCTIGHLALYPTSFTATDANTLYKQNTLANIVRVDDTSTITVSESTPTVSIYAYNWIKSGR